MEGARRAPGVVRCSCIMGGVDYPWNLERPIVCAPVRRQRADLGAARRALEGRRSADRRRSATRRLQVDGVAAPPPTMARPFGGGRWGDARAH